MFVFIVGEFFLFYCLDLNLVRKEQEGMEDGVKVSLGIVDGDGMEVFEDDYKVV